MGKEVQFDVVNVDDGGQIMTILWVPNESPDGAGDDERGYGALVRGGGDKFQRIYLEGKKLMPDVLVEKRSSDITFIQLFRRKGVYYL